MKYVLYMYPVGKGLTKIIIMVIIIEEMVSEIIHLHLIHQMEVVILMNYYVVVIW
jgi:hypothetical protein